MLFVTINWNLGSGASSFFFLESSSSQSARVSSSVLLPEDELNGAFRPLPRTLRGNELAPLQTDQTMAGRAYFLR